MNNRLTIQDLAGILADHTGKDRSSTEQFLKVFIAVVTEGVYTDKIVKIKGLGTFKIIPVEKRESIHVNTGERFLIPEHYKFSFLPDKELKESVNKPFSFFETTEIGENVEFTDMDVSEENGPEETENEDESVEEVMSEKKLPIAAQPVEPVDKPEQKLPSPEEKREQAPEKEEIKEAEDVESEPEIQDIPLQSQPIVEVLPPTIVPATPESKDEIPYKPAVHHKSLQIAAIIAVALIAVIGIVLYLNRDLFIVTNPAPVQLQPVESAVQTLPVDTLNTDETDIKPDSAAVVAAVDSLKPEALRQPAILAKVKIEPGNRLTLLSQQYYGSKIFWVYIYEHNKEVIKDPNNVPIGTELEIPAPALYGIDAHDRASVEKAAALQTKILEGNL